MTFAPRHEPTPGEGRGAQRFWLADLSIRQPVFITMLMLAIIVVGVLLYGRMGVDLFPDISLPIVVVRVPYPGASPGEVERSLTKPIEDAVAGLNGIENVRSISMDSSSVVVAEFKLNKDSREAGDEVRTRVSAIRNTLPADAKEPVIDRFDPSSAPMLTLMISDAGGSRSLEQFRTYADDTLKPRLQRVPGVGEAQVSGGLVREVHVDLRRASLEAYGIAPQQVVQAIRAENLDVPAGRVTDSRGEQNLRLSGEVRSLDQLGEISVATRPGGAAVRLKELATVTAGTAEVRSLARADGRDSVIVLVRKQSGTNTVRIADAVKHELAQLQREDPDLMIGIAYDQSVFAREAVEDLQKSLVIGAVLAAAVVLVFFRDLRNTLVTVAGLPVILLGTFAVLQSLGISLNMITLLALSLSIGLLIDDAIVVRENIFRHTQMGEPPRVAASRATAEIALAVVAVTSTIVAVFLPVAFSEGVAGKFLRDFGVTVAVAVLISLLEAFTLAPMLSAHFFRAVDLGEAGRTGRDPLGHFFEVVNRGYRRLLAWSLSHRLAVVVIGGLAFGASLAILPLMRFNFAPDTDQGELTVGIELPPGARLSETDAAARAVERLLQTRPEVAQVFSTVGSSGGAVQAATLNVKLGGRGHTQEFIARLRPDLEEILRGAKFVVAPQSMSAQTGSSGSLAFGGQPIQFAIQGQDFGLLDQVSEQMVAAIRQVPGAVDVDRSIKPTKPGLSVVVDRARAADLGLITGQIGATVRGLVNGERAASYRAGTKDVDIVVRLAESDRSNPSDVLRLPIASPGGALVPLSSVASLVASVEPDQIDRENRQRQVLVGAGYQGRNVASVLADARAVVTNMDLPEGVTVKAYGQARMSDEAFGTLGVAMGLALVFVYMILASQFGSFVHPFTIMLAMPFSIIGALLGLLLGGFSFSILAMIGIILLMGLVAKNSILLVEFINQLRRRGFETREAILEAGPIRLRPILMTTLALILGMVPVAAGLGAANEIRQPLGVSVMAGLTTSTLLTLVVVPVVYSLLDDLGRLVTRRGRRRGRGEGARPERLLEEREPALTA